MKNTVLSLVAFLVFSTAARAQQTAVPRACELEAIGASMALKSFDTNKDGLFSASEAVAAYATFSPYVKKFTGQESDKLNLAVFTYVFKYEAIPGQNLAGKIKFLAWKLQKRRWKFEKTKGQVMNAMLAVFCQ